MRNARLSVLLIPHEWITLTSKCISSSKADVGTAGWRGRRRDEADSGGAGFALTHWSGDPAIEAQLKKDLKVTLRCIPLEPSAAGTCPFSGQPSKQRVVWAKAY